MRLSSLATNRRKSKRHRAPRGVGSAERMLFMVPMSFLADVKSFDPFPEVSGAPFPYPGSYEPGRELNNQDPGNMWLPDPHPYAAAEVWPPPTEVDVSMYPWLTPVSSFLRLASFTRVLRV